MLGVIAEINIIPDWTVIIQLLIFLFVCVTITIFIIRPTLRIIDRRKVFTTDAERESVRLTNNAEQLKIGRREALSMTINEAHDEYIKRTKEAHNKADELIANAKISATNVRSEIAAEGGLKITEKEIETNAQRIADDIVERII